MYIYVALRLSAMRTREPSAAGAGAPQYPQYPQTAPTAQFGWAGQQPVQQQPGPEQPSVFTQPVQPGQYNQPGGWPAQ